MGLLQVNSSFVMRGIGTVLMATIKEGTLRKGVALNMPGERSASVSLIEKGSKNIDAAQAGMDVAVVVTAPEELFSKGQILEFSEEGVEEKFRR